MNYNNFIQRTRESENTTIKEKENIIIKEEDKDNG